MPVHSTTAPPPKSDEPGRPRDGSDADDLERHLHKPTVNIVISARGVTRTLSWSVAFLTLCYVVTQTVRLLTGHGSLLGTVAAFNLDAENNIPTWYSTIALLMAAVTMFAIGVGKKATSSAFARHWLALGVIFTFLSLDEAASFHELTHAVLRPLFERQNFFGGYLWFPWVIVWSAFAVTVGLAYVRFLRHLPTTTRNLFLLAGAIFVAGAVGMELVGAPYWYYNRAGSTEYALLAGVEELLEMSGILLFNFAALRYLENNFSGVRIVFGQK